LQRAFLGGLQHSGDGNNRIPMTHRSLDFARHFGK
jgi:hypothetical protein